MFSESTPACQAKERLEQDASRFDELRARGVHEEDPQVQCVLYGLARIYRGAAQGRRVRL